MSDVSRTMVKVRYGAMVYSVPKQVKEDADELFGRWSSGSMFVDEVAPARTATQPGVMAKKAKELTQELGAIKTQIGEMPKKLREKYFS